MDNSPAWDRALARVEPAAGTFRRADLDHGDPADRLIIATARHLGTPVVTRDAKIRAYAEAGHVRVVPC